MIPVYDTYTTRYVDCKKRSCFEYVFNGNNLLLDFNVHT